MQELGAEFAIAAKAGDVIALVGGLGAGKTQFCKGFVKALGYEDEVTSPTFSLVHEYDTPVIKVCHFDLYRIKSEQELFDMGWDEYLDSSAVLLVEWADLFTALMPAHTQWINFTVKENIREIYFGSSTK